MLIFHIFAWQTPTQFNHTSSRTHLPPPFPGSHLFHLQSSTTFYSSFLSIYRSLPTNSHPSAQPMIVPEKRQCLILFPRNPAQCQAYSNRLIFLRFLSGLSTYVNLIYLKGKCEYLLNLCDLKTFYLLSSLFWIKAPLTSN